MSASWRASAREERVNYSDGDPAGSRPTRTVRVAHLVRDQHTLCGRSTAAFTWTEHALDVKRCPTCAAVGPDGYTYRDLIAAGGMTYRMLDHWCRIGLLHPLNPDQGSGAARVFTADELDVARVMGRLVAAGVSPQAAGRVARGGELAPGVHVVLENEMAA
jgi:hypothetical protein